MTQLNKDQLDAAFPDNVTGLITPMNMRDFIDSVELKYDNWTVVKPGNINGNKFPDAVAGKITLPDNTIWVINGAVTVTSPIYYGTNVTIVGLSGSYNTDWLSLDNSAGAVALLNSNAISQAFTVRSITLSSLGTSGTIISADQPSVLIFSECFFASSGSMGTISFSGSAGEVYFVDRCINFFTNGSIQFTGSGGNLVFDGVRSGLNAAVQYDIQGTFSNLRISNCYNAASFAMFNVTNGDSGATTGSITNCTAAPGATFITGVTNTSVTFTFIANSGIANTSVGGSLTMASNTANTTITTANTWYSIAGNSQDVLSPLATRFTRNGSLQLKYVGNETYRGRISATASISNATGSTQTTKIGIHKNGVLLSETYLMSGVTLTSTTVTAHAVLPSAFNGLTNGCTVTISGATPSQYNGTFVITNIGGGNTTFDYTMVSDPGASGTGTIVAGLPVNHQVTDSVPTGTTSANAMCCETTLTTNDVLELKIQATNGGISLNVTDAILQVS